MAHEVNALRQTNAELTDRVKGVQEEAARKAYHDQRQINALRNENFNLSQEIKQLKLVKSDSKQVIKKELAEADQDELESVVKLTEQQRGHIKMLNVEVEEQKALVCSLRAQLDCEKGASQGVRKQLSSTNAKIQKSDTKLIALQKKAAKQEREIKKLRSENVWSASDTNTVLFQPTENGVSKRMVACPSVLPASKFIDKYDDKMAVEQDEDDEEDIPLAQLKRMKAEAMEVHSVSVSTQRMAIKQEKPGSLNRFQEAIVID